jgi:hypothetical protein
VIEGVMKMSNEPNKKKSIKETNSMEHTAYWELDIRLVAQEIVESKGRLQGSQSPSPDPTLNQSHPVYTLRLILILSSHLRLDLASVLLP